MTAKIVILTGKNGEVSMSIMSIKSKVVWTTSIMVLLTGCSSIWVSEKPISKIPKPSWVEEIKDGYFVGVSPICNDEYTARSRAMADARKQIVESLGGLIESELVDQIAEGSGTIETRDEFSISKVKIISRNIISVKPEKVYIEQWEKRVGLKRYRLFRAYVLVPFSQKDHNKFIMEYIASSFLAGSKLYDRALKLMEKGKVIEAMGVIRDIKKNIKPVLELTGIRPSLKLDIMYLSDDVEGLRRIMIKRTTLKPLRESYTGVWGQKLDDTVKVRLFLDNKNKVPIEGIPVNFEITSGEADITTSSKTDRNGVAYCIVNRIKSPQNITIEARTVFPKDSGIKDKKCKIFINQDNSALLLTDEKRFSGRNNLHILGDLISQELTRRNFRITYNTLSLGENIKNFNNFSMSELNTSGDECKFIVVGYLYITRYRKVDEGFYFAWCNAGVRFYNTLTGELLASFVHEEKEAGNSLEDAEIKVANKTSKALVAKLIKELGL